MEIWRKVAISEQNLAKKWRFFTTHFDISGDFGTPKWRFQKIISGSPGMDHTLLLTKRDGHQNVGDQFHLFLVLLGVLCLSRQVAPLEPSKKSYLISIGRHHEFPCGPPREKRLKKVGGSQGSHLCKSTHDTLKYQKKVELIIDNSTI